MISCDKNTLQRRIQAEDFAIYEAALYLDAHPGSRRALCYYAEHQKIAKMLKDEYNEKFGPLTIYDNRDPAHWKWTDAPWPWEKEAN